MEIVYCENGIKKLFVATVDYGPVCAVPINVGKKIVVLVQLDIEEASGSPDNIEPVLMIVFVLRPTDFHFVDAANNPVPRSILLS